MGKSEKIECAIPSAGQRDVVAAMEQLADEVLPDGFGTEWTGVTYQQQRAGNLAPIVFALPLVLVFLVLSAQYENWAMPVMVLLGVSLGLLGGERPIHATGQGRCGVERGQGKVHRKVISVIGNRNRARFPSVRQAFFPHRPRPSRLPFDRPSRAREPVIPRATSRVNLRPPA